MVMRKRYYDNGKVSNDNGETLDGDGETLKGDGEALNDFLLRKTL